VGSAVPAVLAGLAMVPLVVLLGACGTSDNSSTAPAQEFVVGNPSLSGSGSPSGSGVASFHIPSVTSGKGNKKAGVYLGELLNAVTGASDASFTATYEASGSNTTVTFTQLGSKSALATGTTTYYTDAATNTVCDTSQSPPACYTGAAPLTGVLSLINPAAAASAIRSATGESSAVTFQSEPDHVQCISYPLQSQTVQYCIDSAGLLTYVGSQIAAFHLTTHSTGVSDSEVSVPAGATLMPTPTSTP